MKLIWYFCLLLFYQSCSAAIRMSQPKILLPYHPRIEANFTLEATDGCFSWSTSRSDLVHIEPIGPFSTRNGETCSLHANIFAHTKQSLRSSATVYARDILTGQSVRCDVIIDKIQTIEIVHTTARLYLEDAPELFKLRAHDQHGSTFSSIEHFPFEWRLLNAAVVDEQNDEKPTTKTLDATKVIRILRLTDSSYEMSETVRDLESHGSLSYEILLEGLRTGSAFVQAEIIDNDLYHGIRTKPVRLSVSANVQFHPSTDVYLLPYSRLPFRLYQIKRQESSDITDLPSTKILYQVKLINTDAGTLDDQTLVFTATDHGDEQSRLELIDRNMKAIDNDTYEPTSLMIRIVNIGYLSAITNSTRPWIYQVGAYYLIHVEMFDVNGRKIYPTDNLDLSASIPNDLHKTCLTLKSLYQNGTQYVIRPNCHGRFELEFRLDGVKNNENVEMTMTASTRQWFEVYLPLSAQPKRVLLPEKTNNREVRSPYCPIKVLGGSGDYIFTSRDATIVTVTSTGDLMEQNVLNSTIVDVFDRKSPELNATVSVQVVQPDEFNLFACPVETDINSLLYLPIQLFYKKQALTCCSHLDFDISIDNNIFQYQGIMTSDEHTNQSCALLLFKPIKVGFTNIRVNLKKFNLQQTILLSSYENLIIHRNRLLLTTKSQYTLQLSNGPLNIYDQDNPIKYHISPDSTRVQFRHDSSNSNFLHVECLSPVEHMKFDVSKQNSLTKQNLCPIKSTISIDITCQSTIHSLSFEPLIDCQCPLVNRDYILAYYDQVLQIKVIAYDENQMPFDNYTSLKLDCSLKSSNDIAKLGMSEPLEIRPKSLPGKALLKCSVGKIEQQLEIEFLSNIQISNNVKLIYINETLSPLEILGGSGYFKYQINDLLTKDPLIELIHDDNNSRLIHLKPLIHGRTNLIITDKCLTLSSKILDVIVSDISHFKIFGRSRLELNTTSLIYLQAMNNQEHLFNLTNIYNLLNIIIEQNQKPDILFIEYESKSNLDHYTLAYRVHTNAIGRTNVKFVSNNIKSNLVEFEVYEKLRIDPKQLYILPLSTIQLMIFGGSQLSGTTIEWLSNDTNIIDLEINNIFKTKQIGRANIRAKSIGFDPLLGQNVVYGEDICTIHVVQINSILLYTPTTEILPNKLVPLTVFSYDDERNFISITDVFLNSLTFTWSLSNTHLGQFRPLIGNISSYSRTFVTNMETLRPGRMTIDVRLSTNSKDVNKLLIKKSAELTNSIELIVLEPFYINDYDETRTILLGPNSRLNLYHIPNDITLELSTNDHIHFDSETKTISTDAHSYGEANLYMRYVGRKQKKLGLLPPIVGAYLIQIKPICYILLQSYLPQETSSLFSSIPVDYKLPLTISYHDELGRRFDATSVPIRTYSYRRDMLLSNVNNSYLYEITPLKNGSNVLVFDGYSANLRVYLPVQSNSGFLLPKSSISPLKESYYVGDVICFETNLNEDNKNDDRWSGDDGMYVDSKYGIGQLITDGERHLHLKLDGQIVTSEKFHVQMPNEIKLYKGTNEFLYDGVEDKSYLYPILFGTSSTSNLHGSCHREGLEHAQSNRALRPMFECHLEFVDNKLKNLKVSSLFKVQAVFDLDLMSWACQIISKSPQDLSTHEDSFRLYVQTSYQIKSNELKIPYQPGFKLSSPSSIYLSEEHPYNSIRISTLTTNEKYLQLQSSDPSIIRIKKNSTDPFLYNIELRHGAKTNNPDQIYIEIKNTLTGQNERVQVKVQKRFIDNPIGRLLASLLLCASLALIVYGLANRKPSTSPTTVTTPPMISKQISSTPRVIHSPPTPKRHLLFEDHQPSPFDSPTTIQNHDQPVVRLYSAQDMRSRSIANTPRSVLSNMTLPTTDDSDLRLRLQRLYDKN